MDYDDDLPNLDHWKPVMEFTVEQAALLLAGIDPFDTNLEHARRHSLPRWKQAWAHSLAIVSAIRQGLIISRSTARVLRTTALGNSPTVS